jgi:hypothetical protein
VAYAVFFEENRMEQATSRTSTGNPGFGPKGTLTAFFGVLPSERLAEPGLTGKLRTALGTLRLHKKRDSATGIV